MQGGRGRVRDDSTDDAAALFPWNFPLAPLTPLDVRESTAMSSGAFGGNNVLSDGARLHGRQRPEQVWAGGVRGVNDMSSVDIGSLCVLTPPVNIPASQIFCNIPSNHG